MLISVNSFFCVFEGWLLVPGLHILAFWVSTTEVFYHILALYKSDYYYYYYYQCEHVTFVIVLVLVVVVVVAAAAAAAGD